MVPTFDFCFSCFVGCDNNFSTCGFVPNTIGIDLGLTHLAITSEHKKYDERFRQYLDKIEIKSKISIDVDKPKKQTYVLHYRK